MPAGSSHLRQSQVRVERWRRGQSLLAGARRRGRSRARSPAGPLPASAMQAGTRLPQPPGRQRWSPWRRNPRSGLRLQVQGPTTRRRPTTAAAAETRRARARRARTPPRRPWTLPRRMGRRPLLPIAGPPRFCGRVVPGRSRRPALPLLLPLLWPQRRPRASESGARRRRRRSARPSCRPTSSRFLAQSARPPAAARRRGPRRVWTRRRGLGRAGRGSAGRRGRWSRGSS